MFGSHTVRFLGNCPTVDRVLIVDLRLHLWFTGVKTYTMSSTARINQTMVKLIWKKSSYASQHPLPSSIVF